MALVTGELVFDADTLPFVGAWLIVKLEDVSLADGPAKVISVYQQDLSYDGNDPVKFQLHTNGDNSEIDPKATYNIRAHVSLHPFDEPEDIRQGDFLTMQSYPVLTQGNPDHVMVEVRRIG